jgi:hypothetical protein
MNARTIMAYGTASAFLLSAIGRAEVLQSKPFLEPGNAGPATVGTNSEMVVPIRTLPSALENSDTRHRFVPPKIQLSPWVTELAKMAQSGIQDEVMLSYVDSAGTFSLGADQIIYLHDLGISSGVITAIIQHDSEIASGRREMTTSSAPLSSSPPLGFVPATRPVIPDNPTESTDAPPAFDPGEFAQHPFPIFESIADEPSPPPELYPVRKPYPVKLLDPILVYRVEPRPANMQILYDFP